MEDFIQSFVLLGVPAILIVIALVQLAKMLGLPTKFVPWASLVAGLLVAGAMLLIQLNPDAEPFVKYLLGGLMLGLGAMGGYSGVKTLMGFRSVPPGTVVQEPGEKTTRVIGGGEPTKPMPPAVPD